MDRHNAAPIADVSNASTVGEELKKRDSRIGRVKSVHSAEPEGYVMREVLHAVDLHGPGDAGSEMGAGGPFR